MNGASDLRSFPSADGDLAYRDTGSGDLVVLLHSGFVDHRIWDDHVPVLAERYRVIAPDTRGHGASPPTPPPRSAGPTTWPRCCATSTPDPPSSWDSPWAA